MRSNICNIILLIVFGALLYSCGAGIGDTTEKLSGGNIYRTDGSMRYIVTNTFKQKLFPNIVEHVYNENYIIVVQKPSKELHDIFLSSEINSKYITLSTLDSTDSELQSGQYKYFLQKLNEDSVLYNRMKKMGVSLKNTVRDMQICDYLADSIINHDPKYQNIFKRVLNYWIIANNNAQKENYYLSHSKIFGPFSKEEYLKKKKELGVPVELKLKFEKE